MRLVWRGKGRAQQLHISFPGSNFSFIRTNLCARSSIDPAQLNLAWAVLLTLATLNGPLGGQGTLSAVSARKHVSLLMNSTAYLVPSGRKSASLQLRKLPCAHSVPLSFMWYGRRYPQRHTFRSSDLTNRKPSQLTSPKLYTPIRSISVYAPALSSESFMRIQNE
jgi:hypothetical protein